MVDTSYFGVCALVLTVDYGHTAIACANGNVQTFGGNDYCALGQGTIINPGGYNNIVQVGGVNNAIYADVGLDFTVTLLNDGRVMTWGWNEYSQLGNNTFSGQFSCSPMYVSELCNVKAIAAGEKHVLALLNTGEVVAWGDNSFGQCGQAGVGSHFSHFEYIGISNVKAIAAGSNFSVALKNDGTVWVWGRGWEGQLGNGTTNLVNPLPVQVTGITNAAKIAAGDAHTIALLNNNTIKIWGGNLYGQLGNSNQINQTIPITINPIGTVLEVEAGLGSSYYLTSNGSLYASGYNYAGVLGTCTNINSHILTFTNTTNLQNVQKIFAPAQYRHVWCITSSGNIILFGSNFNGQLGVLPQGANMNSCALNNGPLMIGDGECPANTINEMGGFEPSISYWINVNNATICQGQSAVLTANTNATGGVWLWSTGDNTQSITVSTTTSTTYTVNYILPNGCILSATATVTVNPLPNITITPQNPSICLGQSIVLTASGANNYVWTPNNTLNTNTGAVVTAMPTATTTYTVTGTNAFGCSGSAQTTVSVLPNPTTPVIQGVNNVCTTDPPQIVTYTISNCDPNLTYTWQFLPNGIATIVSNNNCSVNILWNVAMVNAGFGATINVTTSNAGCFSSSSLTVNPCCIPTDVDPNITAWHNNTSVLTTPFTIPVIGGTR
ncbi:MAG: RCC1 domain-containing protein, partial [Bacteroidia bacterium]